MIRALWSAASGMRAQELKVDVIANNLANVNTVGYKRSETNFVDLVYATLRAAGAPSPDGEAPPVPVQVGHGVRPSETARNMTQGAVEETGRPWDLAIEGEGFFVVETPDGEAYTRAGNFTLDGDGRLVDAAGHPVLDEDNDEIRLPDDAVEVTVAPDGRVMVRREGDDSADEEARLKLVRFMNPGGLEALGGNLFRAGEAAGDILEAAPGEEGMGNLLQGYLERSNVEVVQEMVDLIAAERAYEINSKTVQSSDEMLGMANNLRR